MKSLEKRIVRLERAWKPDREPGTYLWSEFCFLKDMLTIWPKMSTAPKFIQAEYTYFQWIVDTIIEDHQKEMNQSKKSSDD